ncbi:MAG: NADP-dependent phosphogluconate dehydrogenase, partial [Thermicanus sp.]|nr:NADP-dependent phosphogluconate dehydrogenase [Thermicanus sp.]
QDTRRRSMELEKAGILFLGMGVSGGEEGALHGPSLMPGGSRKAYQLVERILMAIAAKAEGTPCVAYMGPDGAGHYVKMVHNGIEYGDMQLISEAYDILSRGLGMETDELAEVFAAWKEGELDSYLIEITAEIFKKKEPETGQPLVHLILDRAGQKGTGKWTSESALDLGVPLSVITESVFARYLSAKKEERVKTGRLIKGPKGEGAGKFLEEKERSSLVEAVRKALYASKIISYAQGFSQLKAASDAYGWELDYRKIAMIWRGGCIIRARFLQNMMEAYEEEPSLQNLITASYFRSILESYQEEWRRVIAFAVMRGIPVPAFSSALAYFDGYRSERLPANLIQAQRDYFGAHTYERVDREGIFHTNWKEEE